MLSYRGKILTTDQARFMFPELQSLIHLLLWRRKFLYHNHPIGMDMNFHGIYHTIENLVTIQINDE